MPTSPDIALFLRSLTCLFAGDNYYMHFEFRAADARWGGCQRRLSRASVQGEATGRGTQDPRHKTPTTVARFEFKPVRIIGQVDVTDLIPSILASTE